MGIWLQLLMCHKQSRTDNFCNSPDLFFLILPCDNLHPNRGPVINFGIIFNATLMSVPFTKGTIFLINSTKRG